MNFFDVLRTSEGGLSAAVGEVTDVNTGTCRVRVTFDDDDAVTSDWLPVLQPNTIGNQDYRLPDIGEDVLCIFLSKEDGFVLGSFYAGEVVPPESNRDRRTVVFSDGSRVCYDRKTHVLDIQIGDTLISADQNNVSVETLDTIGLKGGKTIGVEAGEKVSVSAAQSIDLNAPTITLTMGSTKMVLTGSSAQIESDSLTFKGAMAVNGGLSVTGDISCSGNVSASGVVSGSNI